MAPPAVPRHRSRWYTWNFGDGSTGSGSTATHAYSRSGTFIATLTIADSLGRAAQASQSVVVGTGADPTASFSFSPTQPAVNDLVSFNAAQSRPASGRTITSYQWDFGDGTSGNGATTSHAYARGASFTVTLTVTDDVGRVGTAVQTVTVTAVGAQIPTAGTRRVAISGGNQFANPGERFALHAGIGTNDYPL